MAVSPTHLPRKTTERQQRGQPGKPDEERHCVADRDPVGPIERLDIGGEDVKPRTVIPKRKFDGLEVGAIGEAAGVPGQCLGAIVVGVELVDRQRIVRRGREPDDDHDLSRAAAATTSASTARPDTRFLHRVTAL